jgi:hypothetical protein
MKAQATEGVDAGDPHHPPSTGPLHSKTLPTCLAVLGQGSAGLRFHDVHVHLQLENHDECLQT